MATIRLMIVTRVVSTLGRWADHLSSVQVVTRTQHALKISLGPLTATEKNPGQSTLPGFYRLLPQLVGSCDPGGRVSGDGLPPGLTY
jgi:hypothetical protein